MGFLRDRFDFFLYLDFIYFLLERDYRCVYVLFGFFIYVYVWGGLKENGLFEIILL